MEAPMKGTEETTSTDRRLRRSSKLSAALRYQLDVACGEYGVAHMALASQEGFLLASSGNDDAALWLAANAKGGTTIPLNNWNRSFKRPPSVIEGGTMSAQSVDVGGSSMLLVGASREDARLEEAVVHASRGVSRIFDELWHR